MPSPKKPQNPPRISQRNDAVCMTSMPRFTDISLEVADKNSGCDEITGSIVGVAHLATRAVSAISRPTIGKDFSDLIALGCQVITRFDDVESVYLTFDDSPNPTSTLSILNELAKQEVPATFFCIGWRAIQFPDLVRKIWSAGHEIGNHSMSHPNLWRVSPWRLRNEVRACQDALRSTCEGPLRIDAFRAPYGNFRSDLRLVKRFGIKYFVKWDVAPSCEKPDPAAMAEYILEKTRPGSIILLHDGFEGEPQDRSEAIGKASAKCISIIAPRLKSRGLQFKVISQNVLQTTSHKGSNQPATVPIA
jgi:chitooligosaccharide deacetylase